MKYFLPAVSIWWFVPIHHGPDEHLCHGTWFSLVAHFGTCNNQKIKIIFYNTIHEWAKRTSDQKLSLKLKFEKLGEVWLGDKKFLFHSFASLTRDFCGKINDLSYFLDVNNGNFDFKKLKRLNNASSTV